MKIAAIAFATVCLAAAGAAAASQRVTDVDYLRAARCKGLASGLGSVDTSRLDAFLKDQGRTRDASIYERSDAEMRKGRREAGDAEWGVVTGELQCGMVSRVWHKAAARSAPQRLMGLVRHGVANT